MKCIVLLFYSAHYSTYSTTDFSL